MDRNIRDGEKTQSVIRAIASSDFNVEENQDNLLGFIMDLAYEPLFTDGIRDICSKHGFEGSIEDNSAIRKFIVNKAKTKGIISDPKEIKSFDEDIRNWFIKGESGNDNQKSRLNIYKMCFALDMCIEEIKEFFLKKYLYRPFNMRDLMETVFFYTLQNNGDYAQAKSLYDEIIKPDQNSNVTASSEVNTVTFIEGCLDRLSDKDSFIYYCRQNAEFLSEEKKTLNKTAVNYINGYIDDIYELEMGERASKSDIRISEILQIIYGLKRSSEKEKYDDADRNISNNELIRRMKGKTHPKISARMPSEQDLGKIRSGKTVSSDSIRKTLILLAFYSIAIHEEEDVYDSFLAEIDYVLDECGYLQTYARNPYDWIFLYSAQQNDPIFTFQTILQEFIKSPNEK